MNIKVDGKKLYEGIEKVSQCINTKGVLGCAPFNLITFDVNDGILTISGTNRTVYGIVAMPCETVDEEGLYGFDPDALKTLKGIVGDVNILSMDDIVKFTSSKGSMNVPAHASPNVHFPEVTNKEAVFDIKGNKLAEAMERASYTISLEDTNKMMTGINFSSKRESVITIDGHRIGQIKLTDIEFYGKSFDFTVSNCIKQIKKFFAKYDGEVKVIRSDKYTIFKAEDRDLIVLNIEGEYFKLDTMLVDPNICTCHLEVPVKKLTDIAKKYKDVANKSDKRIPIIIYSGAKGEINTIITGYDTQLKDNLIDDSQDIEGIIYCLNPSFVLDAMKVFKYEDTVRFSFELNKNSNGIIISPVYITNDTDMIMLLPVNYCGKGLDEVRKELGMKTDVNIIKEETA